MSTTSKKPNMFKSQSVKPVTTTGKPGKPEGKTLKPVKVSPGLQEVIDRFSLQQAENGSWYGTRTLSDADLRFIRAKDTDNRPKMTSHVAALRRTMLAGGWSKGLAMDLKFNLDGAACNMGHRSKALSEAELLLECYWNGTATATQLKQLSEVFYPQVEVSEVMVEVIDEKTGKKRKEKQEEIKTVPGKLVRFAEDDLHHEHPLPLPKPGSLGPFVLNIEAGLSEEAVRHLDASMKVRTAADNVYRQHRWNDDAFVVKSGQKSEVLTIANMAENKRLTFERKLSSVTGSALRYVAMRLLNDGIAACHPRQSYSFNATKEATAWKLWGETVKTVTAEIYRIDRASTYVSANGKTLAGYLAYLCPLDYLTGAVSLLSILGYDQDKAIAALKAMVSENPGKVQTLRDAFEELKAQAASGTDMNKFVLPRRWFVALYGLASVCNHKSGQPDGKLLAALMKAGGSHITSLGDGDMVQEIPEVSGDE